MRNDSVTFDTLLYARTFSEDYHWILRADYVGTDFDHLLAPLFRMRERSSYLSFFEKEGTGNFYFLAGETFLAFFCYYYSEETDQFGRRIFRLEGLTCPLTLRREMYQLLPILLCELVKNAYVQNGNQADSQNRKKVQGFGIFFPESGKNQEELLVKNFQVPDFYNTIAANRLEDLEKDLTAAMSNPAYNGFLSKLVNDYSGADHIYSWILGTRSADFYLLKTEAFYSLTDLSENQVQLENNYIRIPERIPCRLRGFLDKGKENCSLDTIVYTCDGEQMVGFQKNCESTTWEDIIWMDDLTSIYDTWQEEMNPAGYFFPDIPFKKQKITLNRQEAQAKFYGITCHAFLISDMYDYCMPGLTYTLDSDRILTAMFENSFRMQKDYYHSQDAYGLHTVYMMNLEEGLYVFWYRVAKQETKRTETAKDRRKGNAGKTEKWIYLAEGFYLKPEDRVEGWMHMPSLFRSVTNAFPGVNIFEKFSDSFTEKWEQFCARHGGKIQNCILSGIYTSDNFPKIGINQYYCPESGRQKTASSEEMPIQYPKKRPEVYKTKMIEISPVKRKLRSGWELTLYEPSDTRTTASFMKKIQKLWLTPKTIRLKSISSNGEFDFSELFREVNLYRKSIDEKDLYKCPNPGCGSANIEFIHQQRDGEEIVLKRCRKCDETVEYSLGS